jgi:xylose isomerase-like TIM barrel protein
MERRDFLIHTAAGAAALAGFSRLARAQGRGGAPIDWSADPGKPGNFPAAKLARISLMTLNFSPILKLQTSGNAPAAPANPNAPPPVPKTLAVFDIATMVADVYGVHNVEFQHSHIESTEDAYLKELRASLEKAKSRMQQINLEFGTMNISAADPIQRIQAIDLTKRWVDHAVLLNCPKVMVNQGQPSEENKDYAIATLKTMGDYARSKGVKVSMETRGGGGGGRGRRGAPGAAPGAPGGRGEAAAPPPPPSPPPPAGPPAWVLLKEIIEKSNTYSNCDIGGVGAPNQEALHEALKALLPTNSGQTHIKTSANWDLGTFVKFYEGIGYKGLYTIEVSGHQRIRPVYETILSNI